MGHVLRLLSSPHISYLSIACGSLVIYKALRSRDKRKQYETTLDEASGAGTAAALALRSTSLREKDGLVDPFANLAVALNVVPHGEARSAGASSDPVAPELLSLHFISRGIWREALGSAKAATNAAGVPEREIDPRQVAAAIAAAYVISTMQNRASVSSAADLSWQSGRKFPLQLSTSLSSAFRRLQRFATHTGTTSCDGVREFSPLIASVSHERPYADMQNGSCAHVVEGTTGLMAAPSTDFVAASALSNHKNFSSRHEASAPLHGCASTESSSSLPRLPNTRGDKRLCVGRVAAVRVVKRPPRIIWQRKVASEIAGEGALSEHCSTGPYIQWPGRYLRVTYQYFVESSNKANRDVIVRTHEGNTGRDSHSQKAPYTERGARTGIRKPEDSCIPSLPESEQHVYERQKDSRLMWRTTEKHDKEGLQGSLSWWECFGPHRLRSCFAALTQKSSLSKSENACTAAQGGNSTSDWMPPLSIYEVTVELRLPPKGHMQMRSRRATEETPRPRVVKYSKSRHSENPYVTGASAQGTAAEAPTAPAELAAKSERAVSASTSITRGRTREIAGAAAGLSCLSAAAGDSAVSDGTTDPPKAGLKFASVYFQGSDSGRSAHAEDDRCVDPAAVKPLKCVTEAWQDIKPQQLVVVSYEAGRPHQSTPLVVLTQLAEKLPGVSGKVENYAVIESTKRKNEVNSLARTRTVVGVETEGRAAVAKSTNSIHASLSTARNEKGDSSYQEQLQLPYSGELIELAGNTVSSDEKVLLPGGGVLVGLGVVKLCLQKLFMRRLRVWKLGE